MKNKNKKLKKQTNKQNKQKTKQNKTNKQTKQNHHYYPQFIFHDNPASFFRRTLLDHLLLLLNYKLKRNENSPSSTDYKEKSDRRFRMKVKQKQEIKKTNKQTNKNKNRTKKKSLLSSIHLQAIIRQVPSGNKAV